MSVFFLLYLTTSHFSRSATPAVRAAPLGLGDTVPHEGRLVVYMSRAETRSTAELLTTCYITYFACIWKSIHANRVPSRSRLSHFWYKLYWAMAGILAPEFILWAAMSQYIQAQILKAAWWKRYSKRKWKWWGVLKWEEFLGWSTAKWRVIRERHMGNESDSRNLAILATNSSSNEETAMPKSQAASAMKAVKVPETNIWTGAESQGEGAMMHIETAEPIPEKCVSGRGCLKINELKNSGSTDKSYDYETLPMVVAQFALMGGFVLKLVDVKDEARLKWLQAAVAIENPNTSNEMDFLMQGLRLQDKVEGLLEDIGTDSSFITTIRGRGFFQLLANGAFDELCIRRRIAEKYANEIVDKCKADSVSKALVCVQVTWMVLNVLARKMTGLPITLLETHVVIQVGIAVLTYAFWWNKPLDAQEPIEIRVTTDIIERIEKARDAEADLYIRTSQTFNNEVHTRDKGFSEDNMKTLKAMNRKPRLAEFRERGLYAFLKFPQFHIPDFITESDEPESMFESFMRAGYDISETFFDLYWHTGLRAARRRYHKDRKQNKDQEDPARYFLSSFHRYAVVITAFMGALDGGLHLTAWKSYFPTEFESIAWKVACLIGGGVPIFLFASQGNQLEYYPAILCFGPRRFAKGKYTFLRCIGDFFRTFHRIGTMRYGPGLHAHWYRQLYLTSRLCIAYGLLAGSCVCIVALAYITFESGFAMRRLPESCYKTLNWVEYVPHF
ncbi:hypothetical protein BJ508DRAFT_413949 [Ascobolus immersus RN42]|uniref:Wax synthase domain-containing protein n=1 Tax=Ascobolus immersus RN42 TaxID=1160509 RepID=A0A3N4IMG4_ASCIM|nr:hypothetical protein BJ508DRAFT_413949 [Ascobolus immersus RN42]